MYIWGKLKNISISNEQAYEITTICVYICVGVVNLVLCFWLLLIL